MNVHARQWWQLAALSHPADATLMQFIDSIKALQVASSFNSGGERKQRALESASFSAEHRGRNPHVFRVLRVTANFAMVPKFEESAKKIDTGMGGVGEFPREPGLTKG